MPESLGCMEGSISRTTDNAQFNPQWYHEDTQSTANTIDSSVHPICINPRLLDLQASQNPLPEPYLSFPPSRLSTQTPLATSAPPNQLDEWTKERKGKVETNKMIFHHARPHPVYFLAGDTTTWESEPFRIALRIANNAQYPTLEVTACSFFSNFLTPRYRRYNWATGSWQTAESTNRFALTKEATSQCIDKTDALADWAVQSVSEHFRLCKPAYDSFFAMALEYVRKKLPLVIRIF
ncbi:hypothetical protein GP486_002737 [Trichoglossum hirsutum]|uniref:Uncharacterized protein n=1 Tax=Trichoglossum hirsutum TaxID=265104 RepID=A0A9P8RRE0_9PEZI|nr:hypothetical protein GP486_002737 [Trichoglossum hirsutum]